jgi:hypothetical protein
MSSSEMSRLSKSDLSTGREREWKTQRDPPPHSTQTAAGGSTTPHTAGSLRARISDQEPSRNLPPPPANSYRPEPARQDEDSDGSRKRSISGA